MVTGNVSADGRRRDLRAAAATGPEGRRVHRSGTSSPGRRHRRDTPVSASAAVLLAAAGGLVLLTRGHFGDSSGPGTPSTLAAAGRGSPALPVSGGRALAGGPSPGAAAGPASGGSTVLGKVAQTEWGDVQVQLTVHGHRIVAAEAVKHPDAGAQSRRINDRALPILYRETVTAQAARIDAVSGATITSNGYRQSLQSAIDQAHLT